MNEGHLEEILARETEDGRFTNPGWREGARKGRLGFTPAHRYDLKDEPHWLEKQTYVALGTLLTGAAMLGIDTTSMEGFDSRKLDEELGLRDRGLSGTVLVAIPRGQISVEKLRLKGSELHGNQHPEITDTFLNAERAR